MKKKLLLMMLCAPIILTAQDGNGVKVSELAISSGTVTFNVSWTNTGMPTPWSDTVWVFVDYNKNGVMTRLPLSTGATLTETSAPGVGKVREEPGNNQGVWVVGNARTQGSFSATVQLLTEITGFGGACAYASNYPPVGVFKDGDGVSFTGTPVYDLVFKDSNREQQNWQLSAGLYKVPNSYTLVSFSDKTGAPGKIITHAVYCFPGVIGGSGDMNPVCAAYRAGNIGGQDDMPPDCAAYRAGNIGGQGDAWPDCAVYRAGSIGGLSFVGLMQRLFEK
jgi:hypothetical protein